MRGKHRHLAISGTDQEFPSRHFPDPRSSLCSLPFSLPRLSAEISDLLVKPDRKYLIYALEFLFTKSIIFEYLPLLIGFNLYVGILSQKNLIFRRQRLFGKGER